MELKAIGRGGRLPEAGMMGEHCVCVSVLKIMMVAMSTRESAWSRWLERFIYFDSLLAVRGCTCTCIYILERLKKGARTSQINRT